MSDNHSESTTPRRSLRKRILFSIIALALFLVLIEGGLRVVRVAVKPPARVMNAELNRCSAVVIATFGDSMTYGLGANPATEAYPMRLPTYFERQFEIPAKVINLGVSGSNTSEGLLILNTYLEKADELPDYALILYGVNNRWNLHAATFWDFDEEAKSRHYSEYLASKLQVNKMLKVSQANKAAFAESMRKIDTKEFRGALAEHGWDMFFDTFEDPLLSRWIEYDLGQFKQRLEAKGVQPVLLTYHFERFEGLNDVITAAAKKLGLPLIDLELPVTLYISKGLLHDDNFHLNAMGYDLMSRRVANKLREVLGKENVQARFRERTNSPLCKQSDL